MIFTLTEALTSLYPGAHWTCRDHDYDQLDWTDTNIPKPSKETIDAEIARLQAAAEAAEQAKADAKQSAIDKLTALGLTADEIAHLIP
jgi:hypothetical protein